jgi:hypothetical protein
MHFSLHSAQSVRAESTTERRQRKLGARQRSGGRKLFSVADRHSTMSLLSQLPVQALYASLLNIPIFLLSILTVTYLQQIYSLRLSRLSDSLLLFPEGVSSPLLPSHVRGTSPRRRCRNGESASCASSPSCPHSFGSSSAHQVRFCDCLYLDGLEGADDTRPADAAGVGPRRVRPLCYST